MAVKSKKAASKVTPIGSLKDPHPAPQLKDEVQPLLFVQFFGALVGGKSYIDRTASKRSGKPYPQLYRVRDYVVVKFDPSKPGHHTNYVPVQSVRKMVPDLG